MDKKLITKFIALPMSITVFKQDYKTFETYKMGNLYQDKLEATIKQMKNDFYKIKSQLVSSGTEVKIVDQCKYNVNGSVVEYTSEELRKLTANIMHHYPFTVDFEMKNRAWNDMNNLKNS